MDFDALLAPAIQFSSEGIGAVLLQVAQAVYGFLYPANSDPATIVDIPA